MKKTLRKKLNTRLGVILGGAGAFLFLALLVSYAPGLSKTATAAPQASLIASGKDITLNFNPLSSMNPPYPSVNVSGKLVQSNVTDGSLPSSGGPASYLELNGLKLELDPALTKQEATGNNRKLAFTKTMSSGYTFYSSGTYHTTGFQFKVIALLDVCDPLKDSLGAKSENITNWWGQTLDYLSKNTVTGITDNLDLKQTIQDAQSNNNGTSSTFGRCSSIVDTGSGLQTERKITITLDLPESAWKDLVSKGINGQYPQWFPVELIKQGGQVVGRQIIKIPDVITNKDGKVQMTFESTAIVPGEYNLFYFDHYFIKDKIEKGQGEVKKDIRLEGKISGYPNFFEWLKAIFPADKSPTTPPADGADDGTLNSTTPNSNINGGTGLGAGSCESEGGFIGWIACPFIKLLSNSITVVNTWIQEQLQADIPPDSQPILKATWVRMRDIAYIILVPIMLVMVIGTALNIGPFDAYTVKKALPRMVAGVIFIALSWYICLFTINVTNAIGNGVQGIIEQPFTSAADSRCPSDTGITLACLFDGGLESATIEWILIAPAIAAVLLLLFFFYPVILMFLVITYGTIILRRIFILALLLVSPLAILPWIFPANNKLWKAWWGSFSKLLLVYPLMMVLITVGHVFAFIIDQTDAAGVGNFLIKIMAYILPLVFIPAAFKFAGGAFATITGMANDKSKGFFDRQKKSRAHKFHDIQNANLFKKAGEVGFRRNVNSVLGKVSIANKLGINPKKWGAQLTTNHMAHDIAGSQEIMQDKDGMGARVMGDDNFMYAALMAGNRREFMKMLADTGRSGASLENNGIDYDNLTKQYGLGALKLAAFDKAAQGGTMFGYKDKNGKTRLSSMAAAAHIAHGDTGLEAYLNGRIRSISTNAGRPDEGLLSHGSSMAITASEKTGFLTDYDETTGELFYVDYLGQNIGPADANATSGRDLTERLKSLGGVMMGKENPDGSITSDPEIVAQRTARRSFAQSHGSQWMGPAVKDPATQRGIEMLKENLESAFTAKDPKKIAEAMVKFDEFYKAATSDHKREMLATGVSRATRKLSDMSPEMLEMLGPGRFKTETKTVTDPKTGQSQSITVRTDELKDEVSYAEFLALSRGSKEVQEVSYQFNNVYESGGAPTPPGGMPTPTAGI